MESPSDLNNEDLDNNGTTLEPRRSARTKSTDSQGPKWCPRCSRKMRKSDAGQQICGRCLDSGDNGFKSQSIRNTRSNLIKPLMSGIPTTRPMLPKGRGRRTLLKRNPQRLSNLVRESCTKTFVFMQGDYFQIGDVVSLVDENEDTYFAQISGLMLDHNYEKSATITWLIPKNKNYDCFKPSNYTLGCPRCSRKMRKSDAGQQICGRCLDSGDNGFKSQSIRNTRSNLIKPLMSGIPTTRPMLPKGRGRRTLLKRNPQRLSNLVRESCTKTFVFMQGDYFQIGDVVSLVDENEDTYFAQISGLMLDHNYEKSATITWLIPKNKNYDCFKPSNYTLGPKETVPRKLECMQLVMHLSPEYFKPLNAPYRTPRCPTDLGFIWVRVDGDFDDLEVKS